MTCVACRFISSKCNFGHTFLFKVFKFQIKFLLSQYFCGLSLTAAALSCTTDSDKAPQKILVLLIKFAHHNYIKLLKHLVFIHALPILSLSHLKIKLKDEAQHTEPKKVCTLDGS